MISLSKQGTVLYNLTHYYSRLSLNCTCWENQQKKCFVFLLQCEFGYVHNVLSTLIQFILSVLRACLIAVKTHWMCVKPSMTKCTTVATVISIEDHTMQSATTGKSTSSTGKGPDPSFKIHCRPATSCFVPCTAAVIIAPSKQRLADESFHSIAVHRLNNIL